MGLFDTLFGTLRRLLRRPAGPAQGNVISFSASRKERAKAADRQRRAQADLERQQRWSGPNKRS